MINKEQNIKLEKGFIEFKNFNRQIPAPFKIYANFECLLKSCDLGVDDCFSYTKKYQDHVPCSFAYKVVRIDNKFSKDVVLYRGKNAVFKFIRSIFKEYGYCKSVIKKHFNKNLVMSVEEKEEFERNNIYWICHKLIENTENKVRDHCHITSKYTGAAHWSCNINLKISRKIPVIFHNLKGYDSHLIFKELNKFNCKISVIQNGLEKYMGFSLNNNLVFIDSMLFMNSSLDKLVKILNFKYLSEVFSGEKSELVKKKGVYPYEYFNSFKKFKESKLPDINNFFSSLKDCGISKKEYQRTFDVWKVFKIKNLGEYHDMSLKCDVLWLCDVFEKFISVSLKDYILHPGHYFSSPGLSWDAMLKMTGIQLEKINIDVHLFFEKGMRVGVSYISKRYSKSDDNNTVMYWDANNLYSWAMIQDLPYCDFKFLSQKEIDEFSLNNSENSPIGYILEVDLEYCKELHNLNSDYSLCPEKIEISSDMLSKYCKDIAGQYGIKVGGVKKLVQNLKNKVKYVVH